MKLSSKSSWRILIIVAILAIIAVFLFQQGKRSQPDVSDQSTAQPAASDVSAPAPRKAISRLRESNVEADRLIVAEGVLTDATVSQFPHKEYKTQAPPAGKPADAPVGEAFIHVPSAGKRLAFESNQLGEFPTIETQIDDTVGVRLSLDAVEPGTPVRVVILDGGSFPSAEGVSQVIKAADWRGVAFEYTTSANIGSHRILVQAAGQKSRIFDFYALD